MSKLIPLKCYGGKYQAIVDDQDYDWLMQWSWQRNGDGYASRQVWIPKSEQAEGGPSHTKISMHRLIADTPKHLVTDHINGNRLDNRRSNLRHLTRKQNAQWRPKLKGKTTSDYIGVFYNKRYKKKWQAYIYRDGRQVVLGRFELETDAALAYNLAARELFGDEAIQNVPVR
jgi:hypothetical protein